MKKLLLGVLLAFVPLVASAQVASPATPKHIVMVIEENHDFNQVAGFMPYLNSLASRYSLLTEMYANTHPSIGNYFELTTGNIVTNDDNFSAPLVVDNIAKQMEKKGLTWKVYAEGLPSVGYTGGDVGKYVKHHNPFAYFSNVNQNNIVPFSQFATDKASDTLPNFAWSQTTTTTATTAHWRRQTLGSKPTSRHSLLRRSSRRMACLSLPLTKQAPTIPTEAERFTPSL